MTGWAGQLTVDRVGADGDGVAPLPDGGFAYLPFTLPGETVRVGDLVRRGQGWTGAAEVSAASSERQMAPCPHFGACGGCTLQHWQDAPYADWKAAQLHAALARAGFPGVVLAPIERSRPGERRRVDLAITRDGGVVRLGLYRHRGREVIDLHTCLVLDPRLVALFEPLRRVLGSLSGLRRAGSAVGNLLDSGIDLLLRLDAPLTPADRVALTGMAQAHGVCRVSSAVGNGPPEPAAQLGPAVTSIGAARVEVPPSGFLQATRAGEAAIVAAVLAGLPDHLPSRARVIELFAGCGTLTFALAAHARVIAYEGDPAAAAALRRAASGYRVEAVHRDLARQPLTTKELTGAAAIVLDPPYAGAGPQIAAIAAGVARVIYVSCNPGALARDARALQAAGYGVRLATPVDQFLWSAAVESVVVFERG